MKTEIRNELEEIAASLAYIGNENCYRVPDNYFEDFSNEVLSKIHLPFTKLPYTTPASTYFEGLADTILNKIKGNGTIVGTYNEVARELAAISPLVASINKTNVYTIPANYFTNFRVAIPATERKEKVIMHRSPLHLTRYAAAAVIVGIIALGGIFLFKNYDATDDGSTIVERFRKPLSTISEDAIANYVQQSPAELDITPAAFDENKINAGSFAEQLLNDIPDSAIQDYLQENEEPSEKDTQGI